MLVRLGAGRYPSGMSAPTRMLWIRHGEVHSDYQGRLYGSLDVPLSDHGWAQARAVVRELREEHLDAVYSSDLGRAQATARMLVAQRPGLELRVRPGLRERSRGDWAGLQPDGIEAQVPGALELWRRSAGCFTPPGGETLGQVMERVGRELARLRAEHAGHSIAVVAHLWVVRAALAWTLGLPPERVAAIDLKMSGRVLMEWPEGAQRVTEGRLVSLLGTPEILPEDRQAP